MKKESCDENEYENEKENEDGENKAKVKKWGVTNCEIRQEVETEWGTKGQYNSKKRRLI